MTMNNVISKILLYGFIILGALVSLFPFYWLAVMATNSSAAFMRFPPVMVFGGQFMTNMTNLLSSIQFGRAMFNTFVVAVCKTAGECSSAPWLPFTLQSLSSPAGVFYLHCAW